MRKAIWEYRATWTHPLRRLVCFIGSACQGHNPPAHGRLPGASYCSNYRVSGNRAASRPRPVHAKRQMRTGFARISSRDCAQPAPRSLPAVSGRTSVANRSSGQHPEVGGLVPSSPAPGTVGPRAAGRVRGDIRRRSQELGDRGLCGEMRYRGKLGQLTTLGVRTIWGMRFR